MVFLDSVLPAKALGNHIYYLIDDGEVVYVGQTRSISMRIVNHLRDKSKVFDSYKLIEIPDGSDKNHCEFFQIMQHKPKYNKSLPNVAFLIPKTVVKKDCELAKSLGRPPVFDINKPNYVVELFDRSIEFWKSSKYNKQHKMLTDMILGFEDKSE